MAFWWVNHRQTFKTELAGGYIWSPKQNNNASRNQTYINLQRTKIGDIIYSYAGGTIRAIGVVKRECNERQRPLEFGKSGKQWDDNGWLVKVHWTGLQHPFSPKTHLAEISPLLPEKYSPIRTNGDGNQKCYLAHISDDLGVVLLSIAKQYDLAVSDIVKEVKEAVWDEIEERNISDQQIPETEKEQLIKARVGQGLFRIRVERIEKRCRLTGVSDKRFLTASHIKPWRVASNYEKLDGNNGLLLSPHADKLFDRGWISFSEEGRVLCANSSIVALMKLWGLNKTNIGQFNDQQKIYLHYHRSNILRTA